MAMQNEHGRLIANAAKAALAPIGCFRRGQSRVWLSDERFWAIMVEFQPSGFSKGTYLNVGASWLWYRKSNLGLNFSYGYRVADVGFIPFEAPEQFRPLIGRAAARAADEVRALRAKFCNLSAISRVLKAEPHGLLAHLFHAAVASGLNLEFDASRQLFSAIEAAEVESDRDREYKAQAATLAALLDEPVAFRAAIRAIIDQRREEAGLPPIEDCFEELDQVL